MKKLTTLMLLFAVTFISHVYAREASDMSDFNIANIRESQHKMDKLKQRLKDFETNILKKDSSFKPQFDQLKAIVDDSWRLLEKTIKELTERKFISVESYNYYLDLLATYKNQISLIQKEINNRRYLWPWRSCKTVKNTLNELAIAVESELRDAIIIAPFPQKKGL